MVLKKAKWFSVAGNGLRQSRQKYKSEMDKSRLKWNSRCGVLRRSPCVQKNYCAIAMSNQPTKYRPQNCDDAVFLPLPSQTNQTNHHGVHDCIHKLQGNITITNFQVFFFKYCSKLAFIRHKLGTIFSTGLDSSVSIENSKAKKQSLQRWALCFPFWPIFR